MVKSLLDILRDVTLDPEQGAAFDADPSNYLAEQGYADVGDDDLREAFSLVADTLPPEQAHEVYTAHVATEPTSELLPFSVQEDDPGAVYGHPTDDFDLDMDDAVNKVIDPDAFDADDAHGLVVPGDAADVEAGDGGFGFGNGADDHDADISAMHAPDEDDELLVDHDPAFDDADESYDDFDVDSGDGGIDLDLDLDPSPFDEADDQSGMHHPEATDSHDTSQRDHGLDDLDDFDLGLF